MKLENFLKKMLGSDMNIKYEFPHRIIPDKSGKIRQTINNIK